jgi:hypothetical protein
MNANKIVGPGLARLGERKVITHDDKKWPPLLAAILREYAVL